MDPQLEKTPGLALPSPAAEQGQYGAAPPEVMYAGAEHAPQQSPPMPPVVAAAQVPTDPMADPAVASQTVPAGDPTASDADNDELDREWIEKAKAIVEQTKHDPRLESNELSKVKADYLRIRYNKQIKVAEDTK